MFDIGLELRDILKQIDGVSVCFAYPDNFNKLPAIAYYTLTDKGSMSYDNTVGPPSCPRYNKDQVPYQSA